MSVSSPKSKPNPDKKLDDKMPPNPPAPVIQCNICKTVEEGEHDVWSRVPYLSFSTLYGPTLADLVVMVLNLLPGWVVRRLGVAHPKVCTNKPAQEESSEKKPKVAKDSETGGDLLRFWMTEEYTSLARELADLGDLTCDSSEGPNDRDLLHARAYVLDRLAEMLTRRDELERKARRKKLKKCVC